MLYIELAPLDMRGERTGSLIVELRGDVAFSLSVCAAVTAVPISVPVSVSVSGYGEPGELGMLLLEGCCCCTTLKSVEFGEGWEFVLSFFSLSLDLEAAFGSSPVYSGRNQRVTMMTAKIPNRRAITPPIAPPMMAPLLTAVLGVAGLSPSESSGSSVVPSVAVLDGDEELVVDFVPEEEEVVVETARFTTVGVKLRETWLS